MGTITKKARVPVFDWTWDQASAWLTDSVGPKEAERVGKAFGFARRRLAGQRLADGRPFIDHVLSTLRILGEHTGRTDPCC